MEHRKSGKGGFIPIPNKNLPKICEDFVSSQGDTDDAGQEGPLGSVDEGLRQKAAKIRQVFTWNRYYTDFNDLSV